MYLLHFTLEYNNNLLTLDIVLGNYSFYLSVFYVFLFSTEQLILRIANKIMFQNEK